ncbi:MAG: transposase [Bacilli bacterium]
MAKGKQYDDDFKKMIVELYNTQHKPACEIIREYGISSSVLYKWIKEYSPIKTEDGTETNNKEIQKLKKELLKTKEENEILKKAIAIFTQK